MKNTYAASGLRCVRNYAFGALELLVVLFILAILAALAIPAMQSAKNKAQNTLVLNNLRQLHLAAFSMATDGVTGNNPRLGWPGELAESRAVSPDGLPAKVTTAVDFLNRLMDEAYLNKSDMSKICQAPGMPVWEGVLPFSEANNPFKVYRVKDADSAATLFAASKNFTYNGSLDPSKKPFGATGFVIVQKGGSALVFSKALQAKNIQGIGLLPGRRDFQDNPVEGQNDSLKN